MSTPFDRALTGYQYVQTQIGDTLQKVALRELGDASGWTQLIAINNLIYPYLTDDPAHAVPGVILNGNYITIPAAVASTPSADATDVFGQDILLINGQFSFEDGDFITVSGLQNLEQAINNVLATDQGELMFHPTYGSLVRTVIGDKNSRVSGLLAAKYAGQAVAADERISNVASASAKISGDSITVTVIANPIQGNQTTNTATF